MPQYMHHWNPWRKKGRQKQIFEEIMDKKFLNLRKTISLPVQEAQWNSNTKNMKQNVPKCIIIKLSKTTESFSNLLLSNKLPQILADWEEQTLMISQRFWGSGIWEGLCWVFLAHGLSWGSSQDIDQDCSIWSLGDPSPLTRLLAGGLSYSPWGLRAPSWKLPLQRWDLENIQDDNRFLGLNGDTQINGTA